MGLTEDLNNDLSNTAENLQAYEQLLDLIDDALIQSPLISTTDVQLNQKFIRNGQIQNGEEGGGTLALFQKDIKANQEDLNNTILDGELIGQNLVQIAINVDFDTLSIDIQEGANPGEISIGLVGGGELYNGLPITDLVIDEDSGNPLNVSQFIPLSQQQSIVDVERAEEYLDTNIFELLPSGDSRQSRIIRFFQELNALLPPSIPDFDLDNDFRVDRAQDGTWDGSLQYQQDNSISYAEDNQDGNIAEEDAFIHRIKGGAYPANDTNQNRTIEDIYNTILPYLTDILEDELELEEMPEYDNKSDGYLKFRNLNQGIIIRNTNQDFIEGLDPSNPTWLTTDYNGLLNTYSGDTAPYDSTTNFMLTNAGTGFTITMWVKFLDKVSEGTLFNYGNPTRAENPFGFKLETYIVNKDDPTVEGTSGGTDYTNFGEFVDANAYLSDTLGLFQNTNSERFVRLQVREFGQDAAAQNYDRGFRSSEVGNPSLRKFTWNAPELGGTDSDDLALLNNANIPEDFNEWYFICASYNPSIIEPNGTSAGYDTFNGYDLSPASNRDAGNEPLFWMNHIDPINGILVDNSGYGNKTKVEIISRTDLLRARGFKV